jgi:hypothetical protein
VAGRGSRHDTLARAAEGPGRHRAEALAARAVRDREMWSVGCGGWSWAGLGGGDGPGPIRIVMFSNYSIFSNLT